MLAVLMPQSALANMSCVGSCFEVTAAIFEREKLQGVSAPLTNRWLTAHCRSLVTPLGPPDGVLQKRLGVLLRTCHDTSA